ncbi:type II secretion system F family protein [Anaerobutyricum hallii]|jgi:type IV pilus assembly protein PilC|uniref:Type II secretion system F family protein n=1 Tax=Anaerobutyricum hallii TaxID=39488 RepID=A0A415UJ61_9FIRM|nr:type II secretion system F family protein [Anaerobutyricum hallii]RHN18108.1 type II secretion system F family protein [Anaerobutyricum hallii]
MPGYFYIVADKAGKEKRGKMEANNRDAAKELLKKDGYVILSLEEQSQQFDMNFTFGRKLKPRDLSVFCRQFVSILEAGVAMKEALAMLEEQTENKTLKKSIAEVLTNIEKGNSLADAMRGESHVFPPMLINMVEAGESSGNLEMAFSRMAEQFEKEAKLKATVRKATVYPIVLIFACIGVIGVMLLYVIPIFIDMFKEIDMEMPAFTMFVMGLSEWAGTHVYIIVGAAVAIFAAYQAYYRTEGGRKNIDKIKMKMPLFGQLVVKSNCSRFARTASTLLAAGVPMIDCLDIVSRIVNNIHYSMAIQNAREEVMKGIPLSEPLRDAGIFPPMVYHMTGIGEETGNIEQMLNKLADYYDEEVEITTQTILAAMEPLIIVFMAVVVGSLVIASILPIAAMYEGLDNL